MLVVVMQVRSLFISHIENVLMPLGLFDFEVGEFVNHAVFALDVPSGAVERASEFEDLSEVDGQHCEAIVFKAVSHLFLLSLHDHFVLADYENVHVQPLAALRELGNSRVIWLRTLNEFPAIFQPDLLAFVSELAVDVFHDEARFEDDQSAVNVRRSRFLLDMEGVNYETVRRQFSVKPLDSGSVCSH